MLPLILVHYENKNKKNSSAIPEIASGKQSITENMTAYGFCQCFSFIIIPLCRASGVFSYQSSITLRSAYCQSSHTRRKTWRSTGGSNHSKDCCLADVTGTSGSSCGTVFSFSSYCNMDMKSWFVSDYRKRCKRSKEKKRRSVFLQLLHVLP